MKKIIDRDFKGVWIDKVIWLSNDLTLQEKVFLVEISSLDNDDNGCFAGNKYFSEFFGLSEDRCSGIIASLKKKLFITVDVVRSSGKSKRKIRIIDLDTTRQKCRAPLGKNAEWPLGKNAECSNTRDNNTINNQATTSVAREVQVFIESFGPVNPSWERLYKNRTEYKAAERLILRYGAEKMMKTTKALSSIIGMPYAPKITSPYALERDFGKLIAFWSQEQQKVGKTTIGNAL